MAILEKLWPRRGMRDLAVEPQRHSDPLLALQSNLNHAFEAFWRNFDAPMLRGGSAARDIDVFPKVDIREDKRQVEIIAELPGMSERDVEVNLADGMAAIRGERKDERDVEEDGYIVREQTHGRFERIIPLPDGLEPKEAKATFKNGELKLTIPKTTEAQRKVKRIPVKGGG